MMARHGSAARAQRAVREEEEREVRAPRTGAKRTVMYYVRQLPAYVRLLGGLLIDKRVTTLDKLLVAGAVVYIVCRSTSYRISFRSSARSTTCFFSCSRCST